MATSAQHSEHEMGCHALQTAPGITPALVERLVASRQDLNKADIKEVRSHGGNSGRFLRATELDLPPQLVIAVTSLTQASDNKQKVRTHLTESRWQGCRWSGSKALLGQC